MLTRPYQYLNSKASIELHHITCILKILIVRFGDQACANRVDTPTSHQKQTHCTSTKVSWLFDELSDNNAPEDGLYLSASVAVINKSWRQLILTPGNDAILVAYQINTHYNIYARDGMCHHINYSLRFVTSTPINNSLKEAV